MELRRLRELFLDGPVVDIGGYDYFVNPVSDGVPRMDRETLEEIADGIIGIAELDCDVVLAPEAMGIPIATMLTLRTGIPFLVMRKRAYGLPGEISFEKRTGYSESRMYVSTLAEGERVAIVDDVIDTGGTVRAAVDALRAHGVTVTEVVAVYNRCPDLEAFSRDLGVPVRCLLDVAMVDGRPVLRRCTNRRPLMHTYCRVRPLSHGRPNGRHGPDPDRRVPGHVPPRMRHGDVQRPGAWDTCEHPCGHHAHVVPRDHIRPPSGGGGGRHGGRVLRDVRVRGPLVRGLRAVGVHRRPRRRGCRGRPPRPPSPLGGSRDGGRACGGDR